MFGVIGNHDHDTKAPTDGEAIRPYEENIGPTNYSFDLGRLHFICLDNIVMKGDGAGGYSDGLSDEVYTWLCNDLKYVPKEKMITICSHSSMFGKPGERSRRRGQERPALCAEAFGVQIRAFVGRTFAYQLQQGLLQKRRKPAEQYRRAYRCACYGSLMAQRVGLLRRDAARVLCRRCRR